MAHITEKLAHVPHSRPLHVNVSSSNNNSNKHSKSTFTTHTKENSDKHSGKSMEILDFRDAWLEGVEMYKDQILASKQCTHHGKRLSNSNVNNNNTTHLSTHNHLHTQHGCQVENVGTLCATGGRKTATCKSSSGSGSGNGIANAKGNSSSHGGNNTFGKVVNKMTETKTKATNINAVNNTTQRTAGGVDKKQMAAVGKTRVVFRSAPKTLSTIIHSDPYKKVKMILKHAREEVYTKRLNNNKQPTSHHHGHHYHAYRHRHNHHHHQHASITHLSTSKTVIGNTGTPKAKNSNAGATTSAAATSDNVSNTGSNKKLNKIIVNTFHASSLLSGQHHESDKTNFLTQNGLTKSAATALETSLYASIYAAQQQNNGTQYNGVRYSTDSDGSYNYTGVMLNKNNEGKKRQQHGSSGQVNDDPCAAIDDVSNYDDSDSEEEYTGYPFYLETDGSDIRQSRTIHQQFDSTSQVSIATNETQTSIYYKPSAILSPSLFPNVPPYLNFTSHAEKGPSMPAALRRVLKWKLVPVTPKIVKKVVLNSGFRIIKNTTDWMAVWEKHMKSPGFRTIRSHQKYNHIPGSFRIGRKDTMWRCIYNNMKKFGKKEFGFMQKSYIMPDDLENLRQVWPKNATKLTKWIVKPPASARGTGIRIINKWSQFPKDRPLVVQKYIERPLLVNDNKFDMRLYVVLTSINPLRIYMYKDGLARFAVVKYNSELNNLDERCMHLTNYSINKFSQNYAKNEDFNACQGHKWTLQSLWSCLEGRGVNTKRLWATLRNLVIKAIISGESGLNRMYRQNVNFRYNCFELFGFDVLLDENLIPWLLEINISPSLHSELPLDLHVKGPLIQAVLNTALYQVPPTLSENQQRDILNELELEGPLCHDKRIFTTCLTTDEVRKHNQYTSRNIEYREEYIDSILENLLPDDVRCLLIAEDELARCTPLERIFPTANTYIYLRFIENARYYNRLLDAWEHRYANARDVGLTLLRKYCEEGYHLNVSHATMEKEPNIRLTEIDMMHLKTDDLMDLDSNNSLTISSNAGEQLASNASSTTMTQSTIRNSLVNSNSSSINN